MDRTEHMCVEKRTHKSSLAGQYLQEGEGCVQENRHQTKSINTFRRWEASARHPEASRAPGIPKVYPEMLQQAPSWSRKGCLGTQKAAKTPKIEA